jgi:hypothetical protein
MSATTTIAPALEPTAPTRPPERGTGGVMVAPAGVEPQHMRALARANEVRLARARMKREIASGRRPVLDVVRNCPWEAESMSVSELLSAQRRWGRARSRKLIVSIGLTETKRMGSFTQRQRDVLARALEAKECG